LRRTSLWDRDQPVFQHPSVQRGADELEDSLIRYPLGQATPQAVMTDLIEKFR